MLPASQCRSLLRRGWLHQEVAPIIRQGAALFQKITPLIRGAHLAALQSMIKHSLCNIGLMIGFLLCPSS